STGLIRAVTAVPMHASAGIIMGYYLGLSKLSKYNNKLNLEKKYLVLSILIPILLHCVYDFLAFSGNQLFLILFYILIIIMYIISFIKIKQFSRINTKMKYRDNFCPNCGATVNGNFCPSCGRKHE
ncbi:MAG: PrsW family glutamic-type intramembrane protease, partial [Bacilli bacterium]|nr:PrsW family glutamic-type intramembrane protease [Bacilli bacterium]